MVIVQIFMAVIVSMHHGFCRSNSKRGNLTKDLPLVPGLSINSNGAAVETQWWEDAVCHPITTIADTIFSESDTTPPGQENTKDNGPNSSNLWSTKLDMVLAVENATELSQWIGIISSSLQETGDKDIASSFASILSSSPMGLEVLPSLASDSNELISATAIWSHYKKYSGESKTSNRGSQQRLVLYIPASLSLDEQPIEWRPFEISISGGDKATTTMLLPKNIGFEADISPGGLLQPLVEDWMARSIIAQQKTDKKQDANSTKTRLTREFPIEHFLAVLMPLLFPLILPFLVSWVKEYRRYKELIASKKAKGAETANAEEPSQVEVPAKEKTE